MDNPKDITVLSVLSLCSGYGGLELGLARALANPLRVVAVEIEAYALANLVAKAEEGKLAVEALWPDLRTFPAERFRGCFDFILAGYPCQPFSVAGKRQGADDPRHLWPAIARIVAAVEPLWCFFENVPGHLSLGFPDVYCSLRDMGYKTEAGLFTAAECGAPHKRERLFILAKSSRAASGNQDRQTDGRPEQADVRQGHRQAGSVWAGAAGELADDSNGRRETSEVQQAGQSSVEPSRDRWPARPGEPQYEWEEPRVLGDPQYSRQRWSRRSAERLEHRSEMPAEKAQSPMGGKPHGTASRVDRLRLLGNGVVPQQAQLAFLNLYNLLT